MTLQQRYNQLVHDYCEEFFSQMYPDGEEQYDPYYWVGGEVGGVLLVDRDIMYLDFDIIRKCVDNKISWEILCNWFYESLEKKPWPNLVNYWKMVRGQENLDQAHEKVCKKFTIRINAEENAIRRQTIQEMISLSNKIEVQRRPIEEDNSWYAFKQFRNTMYDKLDELE